MTRVTLESGRVRPVWAGHPWVFAQAIREMDGAPTAGDVVEVLDPRGRHLGRGFYSPKSAIPIRLITRDPDEALDDAALIRRIDAAAELRRQLGFPSAETTGYRLVSSEGDGLPGLVADVYGDVVVVQLLTHGMKRRQDLLFGALMRVAEARTIVEVAGGKAQLREGIEVEPGVVRGAKVSRLAHRERGLDYEIALEVAQKTGFYFDQRDNRALIERLAEGARVLDLYSYVGAFGLAAARGGAREVLCYDASAAAIAEGAAIAQRNGLAERVSLARGDVKRVLRQLAQEGEQFDVVVVDPPKLAPTARHLERAMGAYRKLNANAMRVTRPGGLLLSCSCSGALTTQKLLRVLGVASRDAGRTATVLHIGQQGMDHPVPAAFPEGRYLEAALVRVG